MERAEITNLKPEQYLLCKVKDLKVFVEEIISNNTVDNRYKRISKSNAIKRFGITNHWLTNQEKDPETLLKVDPGTGKTSTKYYNIQSIIDEMERTYV